MSGFRTIEFMANSPLEDDAEAGHVTMGDCRAVMRMRVAMGELLFYAVNSRYGADAAQEMQALRWSMWPDSIAFHHPLIERARKAYRGEP